VNEKQLVRSLLHKVLGASIEVEIVARDSQFESQMIFELLEERRISHVIPWRRMRRRVNPADALSVKDCIDAGVLSISCACITG